MMITTIVAITLCISCQVEQPKAIAQEPKIAIVATVEIGIDGTEIATPKEAKMAVIVCAEASLEGASTNFKEYPTGFT